MLPELNDLMEKYQRNVEQKNEFFEKRKQMMMDEMKDSKGNNLKEKLQKRLIEQQNQRISSQINKKELPKPQEVYKASQSRDQKSSKKTLEDPSVKNKTKNKKKKK